MANNIVASGFHTPPGMSVVELTVCIGVAEKRSIVCGAFGGFSPPPPYPSHLMAGLSGFAIH